MPNRVIQNLLINAATVDTTGITRTDTYTDMMLVVDYVRTGTSTGTMTVYGAMDSGAVVKYAIGIMPSLTGSRDADGAIAYAVSTAVAYEIPGVHPYIYVDWNEGVDGATFTCYLMGVEK